jgi:hypothetical protein
MKTIAALTFAGVLLTSLANPSSVGDPATALLIVVLSMFAVGMYQAWSKECGPLGWIACIVLAIMGGSAGIAVSNVAMSLLRSFFEVEGSLAKTGHPLLYISLAVIAALTVAGSWGAIQIVDLVRRRPTEPSFRTIR